MSDSVTPETCNHQVPLSMGFSGQEYRRGLPMPSSRWFSRPRDWTHVSHLLHWQASSLLLTPPEKHISQEERLKQPYPWSTLLGIWDSDPDSQPGIHWAREPLPSSPSPELAVYPKAHPLPNSTRVHQASVLWVGPTCPSQQLLLPTTGWSSNLRLPVAWVKVNLWSLQGSPDSCYYFPTGGPTRAQQGGLRPNQIQSLCLGHAVPRSSPGHSEEPHLLWSAQHQLWASPSPVTWGAGYWTSSILQMRKLSSRKAKFNNLPQATKWVRGVKVWIQSLTAP